MGQTYHNPRSQRTTSWLKLDLPSLPHFLLSYLYKFLLLTHAIIQFSLPVQLMLSIYPSTSTLSLQALVCAIFSVYC